MSNDDTYGKDDQRFDNLNTAIFDAAENICEALAALTSEVRRGNKNTCSTCKHWVGKGYDYTTKRECDWLGYKSEKFEDNGCSNTFQPYTEPDFGCTEWEAKG